MLTRGSFIVLACIALFTASIMIFGDRDHVYLELDPVQLLESNGQFFIVNDTAFYVKVGAIYPEELEWLLELSDEYEIVIFTDIQ